MVGFALETDNDIENAKSKLIAKNFDFIVLNNPKVEGAAFQVDTNVISILDKKDIISYPKMSKDEVAEIILDKIVRMI